MPLLISFLFLPFVQGTPRVFHFRGLSAPDERVCMYTVRRDTGIDSSKARELYDDAMGTSEALVDDPNVEEGFIGKGRSFPVTTVS